MPHGVDLELKNGSVRSATTLDSLGTPEKPLSIGGVVDKARVLVAMMDPDIDLDRIISTVEDLPQLDNISALTDLLSVPSYGQNGGPTLDVAQDSAE